ncbi:CRISPR-associated protein, Csd2 family [Desulfovibrio sp. X2]|uniref:type I-C CRISPR-associated protein Cas7/Csd2 n=1 Tax=Desulfovibrio sp. X2 TaxID=941449 RepID=UPI000358CC74|nr:type I-C CRISPR-associated protein Cas7/Csd2 [Desulfovibrio sp. X2]EPR43458.1 CRISPR-associated protein, Csd2 family [Desulfovibrio sp. X2]
MSTPIANRIDFLLLFDVKDGNPNGDPDFDNTPRFDPETFQGLVSDVCLKRKIREWVFAAKSQGGKIEPGYDVFVLQGHSLESRQKMPYEHLSELAGKAKGAKTTRGDVEKAREWMCANFFDVRAFGAVMSTTDFNCGQVRGPVQLTFARSFDRVLSTEHGITRVAYTTEKKASETSAQTEMGRKHTVAYGLYAAHGFISPAFAGGPSGTGFCADDLAVLKKALVNMFDLDHSAARGLMRTRRVFAFEHSSPLGNAQAGRLFDLVKVARKEGVESPRGFDDYAISSFAEIAAACPAGVTVADWAAE